MSHIWIAAAAAALLGACSAEDDSTADTDDSGVAGGGSGPDMDSLPLMGDDVTPDPDSSGGSEAGSSAEDPALGAFTLFTDPSSGFATNEVHDADREIVHFDASLGAMIWAASGDAVSGWTTSAADLSWSRSGVAFRVRFGTEQGERRAYFTETGSGTICNLNITEPERLSISPTNEPPPQN